MLSKGPAKKVTIFLDEEAHHHTTRPHEAILSFLLHNGIAGATVVRAMPGYGAYEEIHALDKKQLVRHIPVRLEFIETAEKVDEILPALYEKVTDGLIEVQDTIIVKSARKEKKGPKGPHETRRSTGKLMRVFLSEGDRWQGEPLHDAILKRLRLMDIAGATVYRGILGYGAKGHKHADRFLHLGHNLPVVISVIDTEENLQKAAGVIEGMMQDGLIVLSDVEIVRLVHSRPAEEVLHAG